MGIVGGGVPPPGGLAACLLANDKYLHSCINQKIFKAFLVFLFHMFTMSFASYGLLQLTGQKNMIDSSM
jgi:hypothetical protein